MPSILIVCTGNICRSPMGAVLLAQKLVKALPDEEWNVSSAGTWAMNGVSATDHGITVMAERGLDTSNHKSRVVDDKMLAEADLVLTMTIGHSESIRAEFKEYAHKVFRLTEMAGIPYDVADPYGGPIEAYRSTAAELDRLIERGFQRIIQQALAARRS